MLTSRQPMFVWWGDQLINLYNDAYKSIVRGKHPEALGQPASVVWREIWDQVGPRAESAMTRNEGTYDESLLLIMERAGYPEETYYTFSYSPVPNDEGGPGGIFCANTDDTQRIIGERQLELLRELATQTAEARTARDAAGLAARALESNPFDLPFATIYVLDGEQLSLVGAAGIQPGHEAAPKTLALENAAWSLDAVVRGQLPLAISDLTAFSAALPRGAWPVAPRQAVSLPISASGKNTSSGALVVGLNPYRLFDEKYHGFLKLVANAIGSSVANAQAYEEERRRAEALAELDRAKTVFFSNVSHEFRTPLTLLLGPLEETLRHPEQLSEQNRRQLDVVHRNAMRLLKMVNTLLDFSRIEAGRMQAMYQPTDLASFTSELASVFRSAVEKAGLDLRVECLPLPQSVYVDREMWEKIVLNLLSNAFKFTLDGEIAVSVTQADGNVQLTVSDTGSGIPEHELPRLFERFHRVEGAKGRSFEGTGIGLALVQELVKLHGGSVSVQSALGKGTTFTVSIPAGKAHLPIEKVQETALRASNVMRADSYVEEATHWLPEHDPGNGMALVTKADSRVQPNGRATILLADDNADMRDYVRSLLEQRYGVISASNGEEALAMALDEPPDLILSDVMMPRLDGFGLLQQIRKDPRTSNLPVILLSARAGEESRIEGLEAGADDYLVKPFTARELMARVSSHLSMAKLRRESQLELERRNQLLQLAQEAAYAGAFEWDLRSGNATWTGGFYRIHNPARDVAPGYESWRKLIHPEDVEVIGTELQKAIERGEGYYEGEYRTAGGDGNSRWMALRGRIVYGDDGRADRIAGIVIDVSQRKLSEEALRRSEKLAVAGRLAASIAHEINNPLEAVTNALYLLSQHEPLDTESRLYLSIAEQELARVSNIAIQTLRFYRQSAGPVKSDLAEMVDSVLAMYRGRLRSAGVNVYKDYRQTPAIEVLAAELRQVFANLIGNALDAMSRGGTLSIRIREDQDWSDPSIRGIRVTIADTGCGIASQVLPHIFEAFVTTKPATGTGLGLWVSQEILQKHKGEIRVKTSVQEGKNGTTFSLLLPFAATSEESSMKSAAAEGAA